MTRVDDPVDAIEELFEDAPCGYVATRGDGAILRVNRTFERWTGFSREELVGRRFQELLSPGAQIYHETHYAPLLRMQGWVREIAIEIVRADGSRMPALVNSNLEAGDARDEQIRTTIFDATDRRRYEQELLRSQRREREIAQRLQHSLMAGDLPAAPGLALDVAYQPADTGLDVGGDWYDAFWLQEGRTVGLVVGDVVGRGIEAATTMGQLRSAVRALAATGLGPAALFDALDAYAVRHGVGQMATVVHGQLDVLSGELRYACAGHLPPAVDAPGGPEFLWGGRSTPLAVSAGAPRTEDVHVLAPGSRLLLYTDGLIERRTQELEQGMARLLAQMSAIEGTVGLAGALVRAFATDDHADDVCVLSACRGG